MTVTVHQYAGLSFPVLCKCTCCGTLCHVSSVADFDMGYYVGLPTKAEAVCPMCGDPAIPVNDADVSELIRFMTPIFDD